MPLSFIGTDLSRPRVTVSLMSDRFSFLIALSFLGEQVNFVINLGGFGVEIGGRSLSCSSECTVITVSIRELSPLHTIYALS